MRRQSRWRRLLKPKKRPKRCQSHRGRHLGETNLYNRGFLLWLGTLCKRHEARSQEGVMNFHVCLKLINSLWEAFEMKAQSPEKFMDVSDVKVTDEGGSLQCSKTIKANNKIVKERIWINPVASMIETQPLETDTDAQLHDERIITVREEPSLHVNPTIEMSQNVWTYSRSSRLHVRMSKKSGWNREEHSH